MKRLALAVSVCAVVVGVISPRASSAAETWAEFKSPHFTVLSNAGDSRSQHLLWQLEQFRGAIATLWPWARTDLAKPVLVLIVKDESSMKQLAPGYWETKGAGRPAAIWASGMDRHYLAIRADVRDDDDVMVNPYTTAYFIYASLVLQASFEQELPVWFIRGLAGVLSNTMVRQKEIFFGAPLPDHLRWLRESRRFRLAELVTVTRASPDYRNRDARAVLDAQSWAFVHYLIFGENGAYRTRFERYAGLLRAGREPAAAFTEAIGRVEEYDHGFVNYIGRSVYTFTKAAVDAGVKRQQFGKRVVSQAESAALRAAFHVTLDRPKEARALIQEARATDPKEPGSHLAEALLLDSEGQGAEAKAAYAKAIELGTPSAAAHYRHAMLSWHGSVGVDALADIEKNLKRAVELNTKSAAAYAALGEVRAALKQPADSTIGLVRRAISLEPSNSWHRMSAARVLWRSGNLDDATKEAQTALRLAESDQERQRAQDLLSSIEKARALR